MFSCFASSGKRISNSVKVFAAFKSPLAAWFANWVRMASILLIDLGPFFPWVRTFMAFQRCQELFFDVCFHSFHVFLLCEFGEADQQSKKTLCCFQITTGCLVRQLGEDGFDLAHRLGAIFPMGQNFLFCNLREQLWDPGSLSTASTRVARAPFLESRCFRWLLVTNLILGIICHWAPPLDRSARQLRRTLLFPRCAFPIF